MISKFAIRSLGLLASLIVMHFTVYGQKASSAKPNIIFILVDDQGYGDLGAFFQNQRAKEGKPSERSPNIDRLAAGGAMLTQHYCAAPVCAPSRASIMLGVSQGHANVRDNQFDKALADNYTMPSTLRELGYSTAAIGKWGLQGTKQFDKNGAEWPARPRKRGFDYFFGYMRHSDGHEHYPKEGLYDGKKEVWDNDSDISQDLDKCYTTDLWTAAAKKWITDHEKGKDRNKPFFMYLAYDAPHAVLELPTQPYPAGGGLHGGIQWTGTPGHFINTASGDPDSYVHPDYAHATYDQDNDPATPEIPWPRTYKRYATANRRIDDAVGDLMQLLKDLQIDSSTLVVYTSDNGPSIESYLPKEYVPNHPTFFGSYGPYDGIKRDCWEGGDRAAAVAAWPGHIPAGKIVDDPSISYDWAPTFIEIAGAPPPERMDGVSLLPSLTGAGRQISSHIYVEYYEGGKTPAFKEFAPAHRGRVRNQMQLLRIGDYVGVRYNIQSAADDFEIYNVMEDPQELNNLATTPDKKIRTGRPASWGIPARTTVSQLESYLKATALQERRINASAPRPYDSALIPAVKSKVLAGISWKEYEGVFPWLPQPLALQPAAGGHGPAPDIHVRTKDDNVMLFFEGYIRVPQSGEYTFYLNAAGKAFLRIHDAQVIDADYKYAEGTERRASARLEAGLHPFRLYYYHQATGKPSLDLEWSGPGIPRQQIPATVFFRDKH